MVINSSVSAEPALALTYCAEAFKHGTLPVGQAANMTATTFTPGHRRCWVKWIKRMDPRESQPPALLAWTALLGDHRHSEPPWNAPRHADAARN